MGLQEDLSPALSILFGPSSLCEEEDKKREKRKEEREGKKRKGKKFQIWKFPERKIKDNL
jgi:hypothetical protein